MEKTDVKNIEHFAYITPFNKELRASKLIPYRTNQELESKVRWIFSHPKFKHHKVFTDISDSGSKALVRDMANLGVAIVRHYVIYPQRYGHKLENIELQILIRMWKQVTKHAKMQGVGLTKYMAVDMKLLTMDNALFDEMLRTVQEKDFIQHNDDMVKRRNGIGLRERREPVKKKRGYKDGSPYFEYLCNIE